MKQFLIVTIILTVVQISFGQTNYLNKGNQQLRDTDIIAAEQTFREAIKFDSTNLIYQSQLAL